MTVQYNPLDGVNLVDVYRRIQWAAEHTKGIRLSAAEVAKMWAIDDAMRSAVENTIINDDERHLLPPCSVCHAPAGFECNCY